MGGNVLNCDHGDAANAVLAAAGDNFRMLPTWLAILRRVSVMAALAAASEAVLTTVGYLSIRCPKHNRQRSLLQGRRPPNRGRVSVPFRRFE